MEPRFLSHRTRLITPALHGSHAQSGKTDRSSLNKIGFDLSEISVTLPFPSFRTTKQQEVAEYVFRY